MAGLARHLFLIRFIWFPNLSYFILPNLLSNAASIFSAIPPYKTLTFNIIVPNNADITMKYIKVK